MELPSKECSVCKKEFVALKKHFKRCDSCRASIYKDREAQFTRRLYNYKREAKRRNYSWELTDDQVSLLFKGQCHYCGKHACNGIDRVDNSRGYILENCVSCCTNCNYMKGTLSLEDFIEHIHLISDFQFHSIGHG